MNLQNEDEIKEFICDIGRRIFKKGMVASNDGNISVRINEHEILCTPTRISKGFMKPQFICKVDAEGNLLEATGDYRPSSELKMHLLVYKERPEVKAVVHAHPPFATTFAIARMPLDKPVAAEAVITLGTVPVADYATPSTEEVPNAVSRYVHDCNAMLLANHGALTYGETLIDAYYKMESLEHYAMLMYRSMMLGKLTELTEEELNKIYKAFGLKF